MSGCRSMIGGLLRYDDKSSVDDAVFVVVVVDGCADPDVGLNWKFGPDERLFALRHFFERLLFIIEEHSIYFVRLCSV